MSRTETPSLIWNDRLSRAVALAGEIHARQTRKGSTIPYIVHPLAVAGLVAAQGGTEDETIAALLHDVVEDGPDDARARVHAEFGAVVAAIVEGCTEERDGAPSWHERKKAHCERLRAESPSVKLVVAADKVANARDLFADLRRDGSAVWSRFNAPAADKVRAIEAVAQALREGAPDDRRVRLLDELEGLVGELRVLAGCIEMGNDDLSVVSCVVENAISSIKGELSWVEEMEAAPTFPEEGKGEVDAMRRRIMEKIATLELVLAAVRHMLAARTTRNQVGVDLEKLCEAAASMFHMVASAWDEGVESARAAGPKGPRARVAALLMAAGPGIFAACGGAIEALKAYAQNARNHPVSRSAKQASARSVMSGDSTPATR